jgi:hypothetical protein
MSKHDIREGLGFKMKNDGTRVRCSVKINDTQLMNGIYSELIDVILKGQLTDIILNKFCKSYIKITKNEQNRSFTRASKTPFTKWYVKAYSNVAALLKVIRATINNTVDKLNKNLKLKAKRIVMINGVKYNN